MLGLTLACVVSGPLHGDCTDPSTQHVRIMVDYLNAPTDFVAQVDAEYLIRALFTDGFEAGGLSAWSHMGQKNATRMDGDSNSTIWWTRSRSIRTAASMRVVIPTAEIQESPLYQRIAARAVRLREVGMTYPEIAIKLGVDR